MNYQNYIFILFILAILLFIVIKNKSLSITKYKVYNKKIPNNFNDYKIVHLSDIHNDLFGKNNFRLIKKIKDLHPDIIVITGDLIDSRRTNTKISIELLKELISFSPIYYVTGNHESRLEVYKEFEVELINIGVNVLRNRKAVIERDNNQISIIGLDDPCFIRNGKDKKDKSIKLDIILNNLIIDDNKFNILLTHRPEYLDVYIKHSIDLIFAGHAHGGQFRIPFLGGVIAPNQGFFPKYTEGLHKINNAHFVISRGIGNSLFPLRINNTPEIVYVELSNKIS